MKIAPFLCAALIVAGCGGKAFVDDTDAGDGGNTHPEGSIGDDYPDDSGVCGSPPSGCVAVSATSCQLECNTCSCSPGQGWACTAVACIDASATCPSTPPPSGSYCPQNGESCGPWGQGCGPTCSCANNHWQCVYPPCPPPVCPSQPPSGSCNGQVGMVCNYGSGCNTEQCTCVAGGPGASWQCVGTACVDAGHTGDSGH